MNRQQIHDAAQSMVSRAYEFNGTVHKVLNFKITQFKLILATDQDVIEIPAKDVPVELRKFKPVAAEVSQALASIPRTEQMETLSKVLLDSIEKLKGEGGADYIEQARTINDHVKTIIDLEKTNIQVHMIVNGMARQRNDKALKEPK